MTGTPASSGWREVDASGDAEDMMSYLDRAATATSALRAESFSLLRLTEGGIVMDAGCGTGVAALELADLVGPSGLVHAIDPSSAMVDRTAERAAGRSIDVSVGDVRAIALPDDCCDGARAERVLIHLTPEESRVAVAELVRIVRPGGRVALVETCHLQWAIDGDDVIRRHAVEAVANPAMGLQLRASLLAAGCTDVVAHPRPMAFVSIADMHPVARLAALAQAAVKSGAPEDAVAGTLAELDRRDRDGTFFAVTMFYVAAGTVAS